MTFPTLKGLLRSVSGALGRPVAAPDTDPWQWINGMMALPNPDPILRKLGNAEQVYFSIATDPHVLGDIRSIRGNFRSHDVRLNAGDEGNSKSLAALKTCEEWMARCQPNAMCDWLEVMWQMGSAFLTGYRPHEAVWSMQDGKYLPAEVIDRPGRRFRFNAYGTPLLVSKAHPLGKEQEPYQFVISRHMADSANPYGVAVLSACYYAWLYKTGGWRYFLKYCERHGLPWPVGRYPLGTLDADIDKFEKALASMMEAGYIVAPEGTGLELLVPTSSGASLPQEALIDRCNREMSKALTTQAMVAELQGVGARAASETAAKRQESADDSVRDIAAGGMNQLLRWITLFNFGDGVAPPVVEFYRNEKAGKERAEVYQLVANMGGKPSKKAMLEELGIPEAEDDADALAAAPKGAQPAGAGLGPGMPQGAAATAASTIPVAGPGAAFMSAASLQGIAGFQFARAAGMTESQALELASEAADAAIEDHMIAPVAEMLARFEAEGKTLEEFQAALEDLIGTMDDEALREVLERSLQYAMLRGAATQAA